MNLPPLFERLPVAIFRPLAATNNRRYWELLCRLFGELWGEGGHTPGDELEKKHIVRVIASHLFQDDPWEVEGEDQLETPLNIRAASIYQSFVDAGWLSERQRGVRTVATVRPMVSLFFETLSEFAERGPEFLAGKVQSIALNVRAVVEDKADGGAFMEAAQQAASMLHRIANTGVRVFDLMAQLQRLDDPGDFVAAFFERYIEQIFIADYRDFRTRNHPLQHRNMVISDVLRCEHEPALRERILSWYVQKRAQGSADQGLRMFRRDLDKLMRLQDLERHLRRLDEEILAANQKALVYLDYKLRSPRSFDQLLVRACTAAGRIEDPTHIGLPNTLPPEPTSTEWLALPPRAAPPPAPTVLREETMTLEERAMANLRKRQIEARKITPEKIARYVVRHWDGRNSVSSDELTITSITDLCTYETLLLMAARSEAAPSVARTDPILRKVPGLVVRFVTEGPAARTQNAFFQHKRFTVSRTAAK